MLPRLPVEVIEHIITFLRPESRVLSPSTNSELESRSTLCACSLLCRALVPISRRTLFETTIIISRITLTSLASAAHHLSVKFWLEVVRELRIYGDAFDVMPHQLARRVPRLQVISIGNLDWTYRCPHPSFFACISQFRSVTTLRLFTGQFRAFQQLQNLICALPLSELALWDIAWLMPYTDSQHRQHAKVPKLLTLELPLSATTRTAVYQWLYHIPSIQCVRELSIKFDGSRAKEVEALNDLLRALGGSLETLAVNLYFSEGELRTV